MEHVLFKLSLMKRTISLQDEMHGWPQSVLCQTIPLCCMIVLRTCSNSHAPPMQTHDRNVKLAAVLRTLIAQLESTCSCRLSLKYIASGALMCGDSTTDRVILQGTLIGALQSSSADLHMQLQSWVDTSSTVEVIGVPLQVVPCSTYPGEEATCEFQEPTSTGTNSTATTPRVIDSEEQSATGLGGVTIYAAIGGGVAVLMVIVIVVILVVLALRRRRRKQFTPSRYLYMNRPVATYRTGTAMHGRTIIGNSN